MFVFFMLFYGKKFKNSYLFVRVISIDSLYLIILSSTSRIKHKDLLLLIPQGTNLMTQNQVNGHLQYKASDSEGECIIQKIEPVKLIIWRFILYILLSVCTAGLFALVVYWYPKLERCLYYNRSTVQEATHFSILNYDGQLTIVKKTQEVYRPDEKQAHQVGGFVNRYMKYFIIDGVARAVDFAYRKRIINVLKNPKQGLSNEQAANLRQCYGSGTMIIDRPNIFILFVRQVFRPLYLFIIFSVSLWTYEAYYYYAGVIFFTSAVSIAINLYQIKQLNDKIFHMAYYDIPVNVLRGENVVQISSVDVVPGDILFLKDPIKLPFQGVIIEGSALINECALTGESVPVVKKADVLDKYRQETMELDKSAYVFEGTTIIQVNMKKKMNKFENFRQAYGIPVCVTRTNFSTLKGQLIRIISFPREQQNEFQKQSTKFLIFLFSLSVASYCILIIKLHSDVQTHDMIIKFLDLITITVPPGLPVSMTFGIIFALEKLKDKGIFCISPNKIISGGRVKHACFDKTGTLTEDFMDFYGLVPAQSKKFYPFIKQIEASEGISKPKIEQILKGNPKIASALTNMATNHSIIQIESTGELVGDPMEIKLFQFGEFELDFSQSNPDVVFSFSSKRNHKGVIYRRFEFDSDVQRMSVVASNSMSGDSIFCYCKGSPEIMLQIMNKSTVPDNYHETLKQYASRGFRVLAIASKKVSKDPKSLQRQDVESDLQFDGFEIFENKLKKESFDAIQDLKGAEITCVMITGDNPLTGSNIAYKCQIAHLEKKMVIFDFKNGQLLTEEFHYQEAELNIQKRRQYRDKQKIYNLDNKVQDLELKESVEQITIPEIELKMEFKGKQSEQRMTSFEKNQTLPHVQFMEEMVQKAKTQNYQFCMTGSAFNQLLADNMENIEPLKKQFISFITVYARTKPNDKARIVSLYQHLQNVVVMCGDGANDCGALKQADVGLSLSQAQASISAPFTSKVINISAVVELIKECRASLATNFSLFNIMALYSLVQYTSTIITQFFYSYPADFQYLYWDLGGNFFFFLTFGCTGTVQKLTKHIPNNSLFCLTNIFQVMFMFGIQLIGQICMILALGGAFNEDIDYNSNGGSSVNEAKYHIEEDFIIDSPENNILFTFTNFMYIFSLLAFSISKPWRKEFYTNVPFMVVLVIVFTYSVLLTIVPDARISIFNLSWMYAERLNVFVLGMALLFGIFMYSAQKFVLEPISTWLKDRNPDKKWL